MTKLRGMTAHITGPVLRALLAAL